MHKKITRRAFCSVLLALPFPARAQQPKKIPRLGYLSNSDPATETTRAEALTKMADRTAVQDDGDQRRRSVAIASSIG